MRACITSKRLLAASAVTWLIVACVSMGHAGCRDPEVVRNFGSVAYAASPDATIQYFGHNFFLIMTRNGTRIVADPLGPGWYPNPNVSADVVTVGKEMYNHNAVEIVLGKPLILRGLKNYGAAWNTVSTTVKDTFIYNVPIHQNSETMEGIQGSAFVFDLGTLCIAHLGDLSHKLTEEQIKAFGKVDIAMIPIGGTFTMPPDTAREVLQQLKPKIAIPMHYRENTALLDMFVKGYPNKYLNTHIATFSKLALPPPTQIVVFTPWQMRDYR